MDRVTAFLKKKGPLGMPMAFWAALGAIVLYLGYRWYQNRSGSSSSDDSSDSSDDTSSDDGGNGELTGGGTATVSPIDSSAPPTSTIPPVKEINPPTSKGTGTTSPTEPKTHKKKKLKPKKKAATHHDHKQGTHHTSHRNLPRKKSPHHHAPKTRKRLHSKEKAKHTKGVKNSPPVSIRRPPPKANIPVKTAAVKHAPVATHVAAPSKGTKAPLQKRTRAA
jgi:cytoskeletal protein RodZ